MNLHRRQKTDSAASSSKFAKRTRKLKLFEQNMSASAIARLHGLSVPTILRRYAAGLRDHDLVARAYEVPDVPGGVSTHRSQRLPTLGEAKYRLRRAQWGLDLAQQRLLNAKALGENRNVVLRLVKAVHRAEARRMYSAEMVRMAEDLSRGEAALMRYIVDVQKRTLAYVGEKEDAELFAEAWNTAHES